MTLAFTSPACRRRPTLLIVGCGDVGLRVAKLLRGRWRLIGITSSPGRCAELRAAGIVPLVADLDQPATLQRAAGLADAVLHLAPPPLQGANDPRVPQSESDQVVARLRANGNETWYVLFADEGHGFQKKPNNDLRREVETLFLQKLFKKD